MAQEAAANQYCRQKLAGQLAGGVCDYVGAAAGRNMDPGPLRTRLLPARGRWLRAPRAASARPVPQAGRGPLGRADTKQKNTYASFQTASCEEADCPPHREAGPDQWGFPPRAIRGEGPYSRLGVCVKWELPRLRLLGKNYYEPYRFLNPR